MRVFLYEFVTGGGQWTTDEQTAPGGPLLAEGRAMAAALADDFLRIPSVQLEMLADVRVLPQFGCLLGREHLEMTTVDAPDTFWKAFRDRSKNCDRSLLIAPEFDGHLSHTTRLAEQCGGHLLTPDSDFVAAFSDKHRSLEKLHSAGIRTPPGHLLTSPRDLPVDWHFPSIAKPNDGAGSLGVCHVRSRAQVEKLDWALGPYRIEKHCIGTAASVAILMRAGSFYVLPPCLQRFDDDGSFSYLGGSVMAAGPRAQRAAALGSQVARLLPSTVGYVGVDLVLGDADDGSTDYVIEVNPRITTSYVGLRASTDDNLAHAILQVDTDARKLDLRFSRRPLEFLADGTILTTSPAN